MLPLLLPVLLLASAGYGGWRLYRWLLADRPPQEAHSRARILVAGPTGVGKTTLIRAVLGAAVGRIGEGVPQTPGIEWLSAPDHGLWFADSKGLELVAGAKQVAAIENAVTRWPPEARPHAAWICVRADAARVLGGPEEAAESRRLTGTEGELARILDKRGIPVIVVITQAEPSGEELGAMLERCRQVFPFARAILPVCAEPITGGGVVLVERHGLESLRKLTLEILPEPLRRPTHKAWPTAGR